MDQGQKKPSRTRLLVIRIILGLFPLFILIIFEGLLRLAGVGKEIPLFIEDLQNQEFLQINHQIAQRYFIDPNAAPGVTYPSFRKEKSDHSIRIVVQGASTVAGIPYKKGGAFPAMLEHRLKKSFQESEIEVINTGVTAVCSYTLLDLTDEIIEVKPDAVIVYAGHNEYYGVLGAGSTQQLGTNNGLIRFYHSANKLRLVRVLRKIHAGISGRRTADLISKPNSTLMERMVKHQQIPYASELYEQGVEQFRTNLTKLASKYRKHDIPLFICTLVSNEKDLEPFNGGSQDNPGDANHYFLAGQQLYMEGDYEKSRDQLMMAIDHDLLRFRAPSEFNGIIREVAEEQGAILVDVRKEFEAHSPHGIIGNKLLTEHVHPNIDGYFIISETCSEALNKVGIMKGKRTEFTSSEARNDLPVTEVDSVYGEIGIRMLKSSWPFIVDNKGTANIDTLFIRNNFVDSLAYDLFIENSRWEETMGLLYTYYLSGRQYEKALTVVSALQIELKHSGIPYNMAGKIYSETGRFGDAVNELRKGYEKEPLPQIAYNLASNLILDGRADEAIEYLEYCQKAQPENSEVSEKLGSARRIVKLEGEIKTAPDSAELYIHLAYQYLLMTQRIMADSLVSLAYKMDPQNILLRQIFGISLKGRK